MFINVWINFRDKFGVKGIKIGVLGLKMVDFRKENTRTEFLFCAFPATVTLACPAGFAETANPVFVISCVWGLIRAFLNTSFSMFNYCFHSLIYWNILWIGLDLIL